MSWWFDSSRVDLPDRHVCAVVEKVTSLAVVLEEEHSDYAGNGGAVVFG